MTTPVKNQSDSINMGMIEKDDITKLFYFYLNYNEYVHTQQKQLKAILSNVALLMASECKIATLDNTNGELCSSYPPKIIIPAELLDSNVKDEKRIKVKFSFEKTIKIELIDSEKTDLVTIKRNTQQLNSTIDLIDESVLMKAPFTQVVEECKFCRCHGRFPVPVIYYKNKYVSRSGTLSRGAESVARNITTSIFGFFTDTNKLKLDSNILHQRYVRQWDAELLRRIKCRYIIDLMVENKKVKYGLTVCTSEKCEKVGIYHKQEIEVLPFPGRESFVFKGKSEQKKYNFRWSDSGNYDAQLSTSIDLKVFKHTDFGKWRDWNLIEITQNYLVYLLYVLANGKNEEGMLIHCVSGWDRTPLFIALLRITLWADGEIHTTLSVDQMLYLTIGYDFMLFGHNLSERLHHHEEVVRFCFEFLQFIESDDYSIHRWKKDSNLNDITREVYKKVRAHRLEELRERFLGFYSKIVNV